MNEKSKSLIKTIIIILIIFLLGVGAFAVGALIGEEDQPSGPSLVDPDIPDDGGENEPNDGEEQKPNDDEEQKPDEGEETPGEDGEEPGKDDAEDGKEPDKDEGKKPSGGDKEPSKPSDGGNSGGNGGYTPPSIPARPSLVLGSFNIVDWAKGASVENGEAKPAAISAEPINKVNFVSGDKVSLYGWYEASFTTASEPWINGKTATFNGTQWSASGVKLLSWHSDHTFIGIYPERAVTDFKADPYKLGDGDLLASKPVSGIDQDIALNLSFEHLNAKLKINLSFNNQWKTAPTVEKLVFEGYTEGTVDYFEGKITGTTKGEVLLNKLETAAENYDISFETAAIPGSFKEIIVVINGEEYIFSHGFDIPLEKGKTTEIGLTVGKEEITLGNVHINDWEDDETIGDGEAQIYSLIQDRYYTEFESGAKISVFAWTGAADEVPTDRVVDGTVNTFGGTKWTAEPQMLWADKASEHFFLAVYPAHEITDFKADKYILDTSNQENSDLMAAVNNGGLKAENNPVDLKFDHLMAKLVVNLNFRSEWSETPKVESVVYKGYTEAEVDYIPKTVTGKVMGDVVLPKLGTPITGFDTSFASVVIPGKGTTTIIVTVDGKEYVFENLEDIPLKKGKVTTVNLNVGKDEITFGNIQIEDWQKNGDSINGEAQMSLDRNGNSTNFANGAKVSVFAWTDESGLENSVPTVATFNGDEWKYEPKLLWENKTSKHKFLAVYPAHEITDFYKDTYVLDTANQDEADLLVALDEIGLKAEDRKPVDLTFEHMMAKLVVNLHFRNEFGTGAADVESVKYEGYIEAEVDYFAKTVKGTKTNDVVLVRDSNVPENFELSYSSVVIPSNETKSVHVKIGNNDYVYHHDTYIPLESGKITTLDITVGKDEITLANVTISDWESQGDAINGEAQDNIVSQSVRSVQDGNSTVFENGDKISVFAWTGAADEVPANRVVDGIINTFDGSKWTAEPQMLWSNQMTEHFFLAVYPSREITDFKADKYILDTSNQEKSDLLIAVNNGGLKAINNPVQLTFDHLMAKLTVNLNFRNQWGEVPTVESVIYKGYTEAEVDYMARNVTGKVMGDVLLPEQALPSTGFDKTYTSVVIPEEGTNFIIIKINGKEYVYEGIEDIPLERGKVTRIDLNVGKDAIYLTGVTISGWDGDAENFEAGDQVQVYGWTGDKTTVPKYPAIDSVNTLTDIGGAKKWIGAPQMLWQSQTAAHYFIGIYPVRDVTDFNKDTFVLDESKQEESDILVAVSDDHGIVANNRGVDLNFTHLMAKLKLNVKFENAPAGTVPVPSEVKVYSGKEATINYLTQKVTADAYTFNATKFVAMPQLVTPDAGYDRTYESVIIPQIGVNIIDIIIGGTAYRFEYEEDITLESGKTTTLDITVKLKALEYVSPAAGSIAADPSVLNGYLDNKGKLVVKGSLNTADLSAIGNWAISLANDEIAGNDLITLDLSGAAGFTEIPEGMFRNSSSGTWLDTKLLKEAILPDCVTSIAKNAFFGCKGLEKVTGKGVETVGEQAFASCEKLNTFVGSKIKTVGLRGFTGASLTNYDFSNLESADAHAFSGTDFDGFYAPKLKKLATYLFGYCELSGAIKLPAVTEIDRHIFDTASGTFELWLTSKDTITVTDESFSSSVIENVTLYLHENKKSELTGSNEWNFYVFKAIKFVDDNGNLV